MDFIVGDFITKRAREIFPAGQYAATCYSVVITGTHEREWQGRKSLSTQVLIAWEIPELRFIDEDENGNERDRPKAWFQTYAFSDSEKSNFWKMLASWRGEAFTKDELLKFNISKLIGKNALLQIIHEKKPDGNIRDKLATITPLPRQIPAPPLENPTLLYGFDKEKNQWPPFPENLPEWMRNKIMESREWIAIHGKPEDEQKEQQQQAQAQQPETQPQPPQPTPQPQPTQQAAPRERAF